MSKYKKCENCGSVRYLVLGIKIMDEYTFERYFKCRACGNKWRENNSLVSDEDSYSYGWDSFSKKTVAFHRQVWEEYHGEKLEAWEHIHHKNRKKGDNSIPNLVKMDAYTHTGNFHIVELRCAKCHHCWLPRSFQPRICPKCKSKIVGEEHGPL